MFSGWYGAGRGIWRGTTVSLQAQGLGVIGLLVALGWKSYSLLLVGWFLPARDLLQGLQTFSRHLRH